MCSGSLWSPGCLSVPPLSEMCRRWPQPRSTTLFFRGLKNEVKNNGQMWVWTAQTWTDCMSTLLEKRSKNDPISVVFWTCGRSGLQGVSKGCQRDAPVATNVSQGSPKRVERVAKGVQTCPNGAQRVAKRVPKGARGCPKGAQWVANGAQGMPKGPEMSK